LLNPHFHTIALDGVYVEAEHGELIFHPLPCLTNGDVADILQIASTRILTLLRHKGVVEDDMVNAGESLADALTASRRSPSWPRRLPRVASPPVPRCARRTPSACA
jgi:hypothetical protein